ncbi:TSC22 domain family protein 1 isoform X2 [Octopus bimaculoides]|uniref:TSC22 domain family protein 1 isoform X2 n=1 Tax=Octopus bimaculoides TaxID=37653 RepID=UPI00071C3459|nr:TSC22 domain family protein 1 isoform X2 [Octopus bimaculoides]|eukprot:XP_014774133.1 PREDICTED: TSC22 domain family protein 1-like [Octopus bimaculoides]
MLRQTSSFKMAELPSAHKMAVKVDSQSGNQPMKAEITSNDFEPRPASVMVKTCGDIPKKRTTFRILGVTKNAPRSGNDPLNDDGDSLDDLDESHTEDFSSEIFDSSKNTDGDQDTPSEDTTHNLTPDEIVVKEKTDIHSRFKVVKIETKEPFRRGRWLCYDFLDTPANAERNEIKFMDDATSGNSSACSSVNYIFGVDDPSKNPFLPPVVTSVDGSVANVSFPVHQSGIHAQSNNETFKPIQTPSQSSQSQTQVAFQQTSVQTDVASVSGAKIPGAMHTNSISLTTSNTLQSQTHVSQGHQNSSSTSKAPVNSSVNLVKQTAVTSNAQAIPGSQSGSTIRESSNLTAPSIPKVLPSPVTRANTAQGGTPIIHVSNVSNTDVHGSASIPTVSSKSMNVQSAQLHSVPVVSQTSAGHQPGTVSVNSHMPLPGAVTPVLSHQPQDSKPEKPVSVLGHDVKGDHVNIRPENIQLNDTFECDKLFDANFHMTALSLTPLTTAVSEMGTPAKEGKEDSGSSTVAIDNKIEQAMDLVKSHLMFAVREEVEVLKEQIKELTEKNNQLEYENSILRTSASPDTLSKLSQPRPQPPAATTS